MLDVDLHPRRREMQRHLLGVGDQGLLGKAAIAPPGPMIIRGSADEVVLGINATVDPVMTMDPARPGWDQMQDGHRDGVRPDEIHIDGVLEASAPARPSPSAGSRRWPSPWSFTQLGDPC